MRAVPRPGPAPPAARGERPRAAKSPRFHAPRAAAPTAAANSGWSGPASVERRAPPSRPTRSRRAGARARASDVTSRSARSPSAVGDRALERRAQVVVVGQHPLDPVPARRGSARPAAACSARSAKYGACRGANRSSAPASPQALPPVRAQRLQDAVAGAGRRRPARSPSTCRRAPVSRSSVSSSVVRRLAAHAVCRVEVEPAGEDRQPREQGSLAARRAAGRTSRSPRRGSGAAAARRARRR